MLATWRFVLGHHRVARRRGGARERREFCGASCPSTRPAEVRYGARDVARCGARLRNAWASRSEPAFTRVANAVRYVLHGGEPITGHRVRTRASAWESSLITSRSPLTRFDLRDRVAVQQSPSHVPSFCCFSGSISAPGGPAAPISRSRVPRVRDAARPHGGRWMRTGFVLQRRVCSIWAPGPAGTLHCASSSCSGVLRRATCVLASACVLAALQWPPHPRVAAQRMHARAARTTHRTQATR